VADFVIRDSNSRIRITCLRRGGSIFNLNGYTVQLKYRIGDVHHDPVNMTVTDADLGQAEYAFVTGVAFVVDATNEKIDFYRDTIKVATVANASYLSGYSLADAIKAALIAADPIPWTVDYIPTVGFVISNTGGYQFKMLTLTGVNLATAIWTLIGLNGTTEILDDYATSTTVPTIANPTDLSEEGIMYAEVEVTETATGKLTSSSEVLLLTVRGKVSNG